MVRLLLVAVATALISTAASAERRVALVLGEDDYTIVRPLKNPDNDARAIEGVLKQLGFDVTVETDRDLKRLRRALDDFRDDAKGADVALVFFSGHGVEIGGDNRLLPVDADASSLDALKNTSLPLEEVRDAVAASGRVGIVLLDACRSDPFGSASTGTDGRGAVALTQQVKTEAHAGLGRVGKADNMLFAFAAAPGETAADGDGDNSPFTSALVKYFGTDGLEIRSTLTLVQQEVYDQSRAKQLPYIENGLPQVFFTATPKDQLPERDRLLLAMADVTPGQRAQVEKVAAQNDMPLAPLYGALLAAEAAGQNSSQRDTSLSDAAEAFVRVRDEMKRLSGGDPKVAALRKQAENQLALGAFKAARQLLAQAADIDEASRQNLQTNLAERALSEAATRYLSAGAARADLAYDLAIQDYEATLKLFDQAGSAPLSADDYDRQIKTLDELGKLYVTVGKTDSAGQVYETLLASLDKQAKADSDLHWQRDLGVGHIKLGNVRLAQGDLQAAIDQYGAARQILEKAVTADPSKLDWFGDLANADDKIGRVLMSQGDLAGAAKAFQESAAVKKQLSDNQPGRDDLKRDLTIAYDEIGDLARQAGDFDSAASAYQQSLDIRAALAAKAPDDLERQRDVSVSYETLGDVARDRDDNQGALASYQKALDIGEQLAARDPQNTELKRDLSVSHTKVGNALRSLERLPEALDAYRQSLAISRALAEGDPGNTDLQRDFSICLENVADIQSEQKDHKAALAGYEESLVIVKKLAALDPGNSDWQRDLAITLSSIGFQELALRDFDAARDSFSASLDIHERLAEADPDNAGWQRELAVAYLDMATVTKKPKPLLAKALAIVQELDKTGRLAPRYQFMIGYIQDKLRKL